MINVTKEFKNVGNLKVMFNEILGNYEIIHNDEVISIYDNGHSETNVQMVIDEINKNN